MIEDLNMSEDLRQRATVRLPEVAAPSPEELPDALAAELLWELALQGADVGWSQRHLDGLVEVIRNDMTLVARLNKAEWVFRDGMRRWIPGGGMVTVALALENPENGTPHNYVTKFSGPVSREDFIEHVAGLMVDLKSKYVINQIERFRE